MAEEKKTYEDMSNPEKIEAKKRKIKKLFRDLPPEKKQFAEGLINQFAVTTVTRSYRRFCAGRTENASGVPRPTRLQHDD